MGQDVLPGLPCKGFRAQFSLSEENTCMPERMKARSLPLRGAIQQHF